MDQSVLNVRKEREEKEHITHQREKENTYKERERERERKVIMLYIRCLLSASMEKKERNRI